MNIQKMIVSSGMRCITVFAMAIMSYYIIILKKVQWEIHINIMNDPCRTELIRFSSSCSRAVTAISE